MMVIHLPHSRRSIPNRARSVLGRSAGGWCLGGSAAGPQQGGGAGLLVPSGPRRAPSLADPRLPASPTDRRRLLSSLVPSRPGSLAGLVGVSVGPRTGWLGLYPVSWLCAARPGWLSGLAGRRRQPGRCRRPPPAAAAAIRRESGRPVQFGHRRCGIYMRGEYGGLRDVWVSSAGGARLCVRAARVAGARAPTRRRHLCTSIPLAAATRASAHAVPCEWSSASSRCLWTLHGLACARARTRARFGAVGAEGGGRGARAHGATAPGAWPSRAGERHRCRVAARHAGRAPEARKKETRRAW